MRVCFFGTPRLAAECLSELLKHHTVEMVVTKPDTQQGRGRRLSKSPVKQVAEKKNIPVYQPLSLPDELPDELERHSIEVNVVVAFGKLLPSAVINRPPLGSVNLHGSLLPAYRGPSPIEAALLNGDRETGLTLQLMREKMDAGPVLAQHRIEITEDMNARDLYREMTALGPAFLAENLSRYGSGELTPRSQPDEEATYCRMIRKEDGLIQWDRPAPEVHNRIRAFALWPVAYTFLDGKMLRVHRSALCGEGAAGEGSTLDGSQGGIPGSHESGSGTRGTVPGTIVKTDRQRGVLVQAGQGCVRLLEVQPANRKAMSHLEFMNGYRDLTGKVLG